MEALIVTGASRGLGAHLLDEGRQKYDLRIGLSRSELYAVPGEAAANSRIRVDFSQRAEVEAAAASLCFGLGKTEGLTALTLVHNAGTLDPLLPAIDASAVLLDESLRVNLLAPMILSAKIGAFCKQQGIKLQIVFISSSAAKQAKRGWSSYASAKAGLEMYAKCLAMEQPDIGVLIADPGIMDTDMQQQIRGSDEANFPDVGKFRHYKQSGKLSHPSVVAKNLMGLLQAGFWQSGDLVKLV